MENMNKPVIPIKYHSDNNNYQKNNTKHYNKEKSLIPCIRTSIIIS